ncbi:MULTISPECIES: hypothetical protein [Halomonadaceae]|jgi:hypothetical protein|uniref:Uncharacterized protein n=2 Tax=Vreelandella TaxID=3137766 RepID=A0A7Z0LXQ3_9GAMM|nr:MULTISPECIES: hypothetical protein [Halomonas]NYS80501.1 hypothetical protein [Halomonas glaciei]|tara:strand:- start:4153 stop:4662 length:510 start_codon:yes stop_codon:yes gene_type:complete
MSSENARSFSVSRGSILDGEYTLEIHPDAFADTANHESLQRVKNERKYNVRIKQHDLYLLDALAEHEGVPRSVLINKLLHDVLHDELMSIPDRDARALLAKTADECATYDALSRPWVVDAIGSECQDLLENILAFNVPYEMMPEPGVPEDAYNSDTFIGIKEKLAGVKK